MTDALTRLHVALVPDAMQASPEPRIEVVEPQHVAHKSIERRPPAVRGDEILEHDDGAPLGQARSSARRPASTVEAKVPAPLERRLTDRAHAAGVATEPRAQQGPNGRLPLEHLRDKNLADMRELDGNCGRVDVEPARSTRESHRR